MRRVVALAIALLGVYAASCGDSNPAPAPTPPRTTTSTTTSTIPPTRTLRSVALTSTANSLQAPNQTAAVIATGTFSDGTTQNITSSCTGWTADNTFVLSVSGTGLVTARNSGQSTIGTTCQGIFATLLVTLNLAPPFVRSGSGNNVFDMPTYVSRVRIQGRWNGQGLSNFVVFINGRLIVNEILRQTITFDGTFATTGGVTEIVDSTSIAWTFTEVRQ